MSDYIENNLADSTPLKKFELSLSKVIAKGKSKKEADFREAYNAIEQNLAKGVPQRVVIEKFNEAYGCTLHPPAFRKLLLEERKRYAESGEVIICNACGQKLVRDDCETSQETDVAEE